MLAQQLVGVCEVVGRPRLLVDGLVVVQEANEPILRRDDLRGIELVDRRPDIQGPELGRPGEQVINEEFAERQQVVPGRGCETGAAPHDVAAKRRREVIERRGLENVTGRFGTELLFADQKSGECV